MKIQPVIAEFFGSRLGLPSDALVPTMLAAAALAITFDPALRLWLMRRRAPARVDDNRWRRLSHWLLGGRIRPQEEHPITGPLMRVYDPVVR